MRPIALFLPNWVGDVVMATPAIRAVRDAFPAADLVAVCKPYVADVLDGAPWFRDVILADKRGPREQRLFAVGPPICAQSARRRDSLPQFVPHRAPGAPRRLPAGDRLRPLRPLAVAHGPLASINRCVPRSKKSRCSPSGAVDWYPAQLER